MSTQESKSVVSSVVRIQELQAQLEVKVRQCFEEPAHLMGDAPRKYLTSDIRHLLNRLDIERCA